jgi:hypothetical protein
MALCEVHGDCQVADCAERAGLHAPPSLCGLKLAQGHHVPYDACNTVDAQVADKTLSSHGDTPDQRLDDAGLLAGKELLPMLGELLQGVDGFCHGDVLAIQCGNTLRRGLRCRQHAADFGDDGRL